MYNWDGIKYPTVINNNNYYILIRRKNPEIALVVLYVSVDMKAFTEKLEVKFRADKSVRQSYVSKYYRARDKKSVLLLIPGEILIEKDLIKVAHVGVNFKSQIKKKKTLFSNPRMVYVGF